MGRLCVAVLLCLFLASVACEPTVVVVVATPEPTATPRLAPSPSPTAMSRPMPTPDPNATFVFSDLDWPSAQIQNSIVRRILEDGYGYATDAVYGETDRLLEALAQGDTNISMEIWVPIQQDWYTLNVAFGRVTSLGKSLEDNWQSAFIIPQYVADAYPGLQTVQDLKKPEYTRLFANPSSDGKARLISCLPGWECAYINERKISAYGLRDTVELKTPESETSLAATILSAFQKEEPVLFYYWEPTVLAQLLQTKYGGFKILEEPQYTESCFETTYACAYPTAEVHIVVRTELLQTAPDAIEFLRNWDFHHTHQIAAEQYHSESGAAFSEVAAWFLHNTTQWQEWVTPEARDNVLAALP